MALRYDFDMAPAVPGRPRRALWRDPAVPIALAKADPVVRDYFSKSGFGMDVFDSGAPPGRFPAEDEAARARIINNLTENVQAVDVPGLNWGGFNLRDFLGYLGSATPIDMPTPPVTPATPPPPEAETPSIRITDSGPKLDFDQEDLRRAMQPSKRKALAMMGLAAGVILLAIAALMALP